MIILLAPCFRTGTLSVLGGGSYVRITLGANIRRLVSRVVAQNNNVITAGDT
jgi:hypothetical protein